MCCPVIKHVNFDTLTDDQREELEELRRKLEKRRQDLQEYLRDVDRSLECLSPLNLDSNRLKK